MTKDSKTVSTIRRRKGKQVALALQKIKEENPKPSPFSEKEIVAAEAEDKCYMFDDRVLGPMTLRWLMSNNTSLFLALLVIRCANALLIQTQHVPDEYWQSLEVAHKMVFGYGHLTWEWREGLRGYTHPLVFAVVYKILDVLGLDNRVFLIKIPRLVQAGIAAWADLCLYKLSSKLSGRATAQWTLLFQLLSWFTIYCCTRTLSNSMETTLITAALSYFPWPDLPLKPKDMYKFLALAALSIVIRPTAALVWILLCSWHLQHTRGSANFASIFNAYLVTGFSSLSLSAIVDRIWYGRWIIVQLNFLFFNVFTGGANIYGVHPWHWYFIQGFPVVMGTLIFPFAVGAWRAKNKVLLWIILWILATHSFLPHKEFRFIMPVLPLACHYAGVYFQTLCSKPPVRKFRSLQKKQLGPDGTTEHAQEEMSTETLDGEGSVKPGSNLKSGKSFGEIDKKQSQNLKQKLETQMKGDSVTEAKGNSPTEVSESEASKTSSDDTSAAGKVHSESKDDDMEEDIKHEEESELISRSKDAPLQELDQKQETSPEMLRDQHHHDNLQKARLFVIVLAVTNLVPALYFCLLHQRGTVMVTKFIHDYTISHPDTDVLFLMPCHSTPYYSYVHRNISMRFLTCEPNLQGVANYTDEADTFYQDPSVWLHTEYTVQKKPWPSLIVYFNSLQADISKALLQGGYRQCENFFHTHVQDGRVGSHVLVSCR